ncbi:T9SS type A sorting domain-containing protein [Nostoc sp. NIES-2111]
MLALTAGMFVATPSSAQLYQPEGLHMPGAWVGWQNLPDPSTYFAFRGTTTGNCGTGNNACAAGGINKVTSALGITAPYVYQTTIHAAASGGDVVGGNYDFLFTSGPGFGGQYNNKWANVNVTMNTLQTYIKEGSSNNNITVVNDKWYTMNWVDNGYGNTPGIFMETSAAPISITNISQSPAVGSITPSDPVVLTITLSAAKSAEENIFIRYSTNSFSTSSIIQATGSGTTYTATIPAQANGTTVNYYALTSTVSQATLSAGNYDAYAIRYKNNGGSTYTYTSASVPPVNITFRVDMQNETVSGGGLHLAGNFNGYSTSAITLTQEGSTSIYSAVVPLAQNTSIQYKFVNGSSFEDNIPTPCGNGSNRVYSVGTTDATVSLTCYSKCGACPPFHPVTFQVDMQNEAGVTAVYVSGEFNGYNTTANPMTNVSGTLWTTTINLEEGRNYAYKFVRNAGDYENNIPSGTCNPGGAGGNNRAYAVTTAASQTIPVTCFSSCGACTALSTVTMSVDMRDQVVTNGVMLSGNFNSFNTTATPMNRIGTTSVYTVTITVAEGTNLSYKFVNGNGTNNYEGNLGAPCGSGNRSYTVPATNTTIPTVCFGSCTACPPKYNVTFKVNMAGQTVTGPVALVGDFNGYNPASNVMTQIGSTGVYQATVNITQGAHQYKFYNTGGPNSGYENNIGAPCGNGGNRTYTVASAATLPTVCFNSCIDCGALNTWTGASSSDFTNGANWNSGLAPSACGNDAQVNGGGTQPQLNGTSSVTLSNLTLNSGASLTVASGATMNLCGNLSGAGSINGGSLILNGTGAQTISGNTSVDNLTITKSSGSVSVTGRARVNKNLTLSNATSGLTVSGGGQVILSSNASGTARLNPVPAGAAITGNLTLERYMGATSAWHFIGSPFTSATQLSDYNEISVRVTPKNNSNIFEYTEGDTTRGTYNGYLTESKGWKVPSALTNSINPGNAPKGYRAYASGGRTLSVSGSPFIGDKVASFTFTPAGGWDGGGWNLLANPYPSEIDWNAFRFDGANTAASITNAVTIWNAGSSNYGSYTALNSTTGIGTGISSQYIASSQAFFVRATGAGSVTFKEAHKSNANATSFLRDGQLANMLKMKVTQGNNWDETAVLFYAGGAVGRDQFDADNMGGSSVDVSTKPVTGLDLAINIMPELNGRYEVPVTFTTSGTGTTTVSFTGVETFDANYNVYLRDNFLGTLTDLNTTQSIDIQVTSNPASSGNSRFTLVFAPSSVTGVHETVSKAASMDVWPNPASGAAKLNVSLNHFSGDAATVILTDVTGKVVLTQSVSLKGDATASFDISALPAGVYSLKAQGTAQTLQERVVVR